MCCRVEVDETNTRLPSPALTVGHPAYQRLRVARLHADRLRCEEPALFVPSRNGMRALEVARDAARLQRRGWDSRYIVGLISRRTWFDSTARTQ